jgi:hypothetical protein
MLLAMQGIRVVSNDGMRLFQLIDDVAHPHPELLSDESQIEQADISRTVLDGPEKRPIEFGLLRQLNQRQSLRLPLLTEAAADGFEKSFVVKVHT